jgi:transcriptional regulator with XRE-family HTH domain
MTSKNEFSGWLRKQLEKEGLKQKELAKKIGVSADMVSKLLRGDRCPGKETLELFSKTFNVSFDYLENLVKKGNSTDNRKKETSKSTPSLITETTNQTLLQLFYNVLHVLICRQESEVTDVLNILKKRAFLGIPMISKEEILNEISSIAFTWYKKQSDTNRLHSYKTEGLMQDEEFLFKLQITRSFVSLSVQHAITTNLINLFNDHLTPYRLAYVNKASVAHLTDVELVNFLWFGPHINNLDIKQIIDKIPISQQDIIYIDKSLEKQLLALSNEEISE